MNALRRYSPFIAAFVLACVGAQTLDLGLCCGPPPPAPTPSETETIAETGVTPGVMGAGGFLSAAAPSPAPGDAAPGEERSSSSHAAQPDCLCHLVFTSTSLAPPLLAAATPTLLAAKAPERLRSALLLPPGQVPIA